jgi:hypothetical protein
MCDTVMNRREMGRTDEISDSLTGESLGQHLTWSVIQLFNFQLLQAKRGLRQDGKCLETNRTGCQGSGQEKRSGSVSVGVGRGWFGLAASARCPNTVAGAIGGSAGWIPPELRSETNWLCLATRLP